MEIRELIIDANECEGDLNDEKLLLQILISAAKKVEANVVNALAHKYNPQGVTVVVLLAESHLSISTWPEFNYANVEIFLCNDSMRPYIVWDEIKSKLKPKVWKIDEIIHRIE